MLVFYQTLDGKIRLDARLQDETLWLTQAQLAELFQKDVRTISEHIVNIYEEEELTMLATLRNFRKVQVEGKREVARDVAHYNLDIILAIGYRVRSARGTQFRQWATATLKEYLVKGFVLNDERLKNPGGWDYFDELLERIREIRASEKRFYQKIRDIYITSIDYNAKSKQAKLFFKTVQNKMLFAVTHKTAAELLVERADEAKPNMGLKTWQGSRVRKMDVAIAKNYLNKEELSELDRIVAMFLDYAEDQAKRQQTMSMKNWEERLDAFLQFNNRSVLMNAGEISHEKAEEITHQRFDVFDAARRQAELTVAEAEAMQELEALEKKDKV